RTPPLREHLEDLALLVEHFARKFSEAANYRRKSFSPGALELLARQAWKGNVRELRNVVERLLILAPTDVVGEGDVASIVGGPGPELAQAFHGLRTLREFREQAERLFLLQKLEANGWNVTRTAEAIDTPRSNLYKKLDQYGLRRAEEGGDGG
ncbi:MAG: sigma-54-dependent Fis family transcriptional regulator, partial [Thermoanaerobaculia bacterium]|nr:sigma-54-dependent Fis family transcriptional regulator [Thermoanaerobaculia bacterium]